MKKILLTGGHAGTTALAVIEELQRDGNFEIFWIGSSNAVEGKNIKTLESKLLSNKNIKYFEINSGRLQRRFTRHTLLSLTKVPAGFLQANSLVNKIAPDIVLSFRGFAALPVVFSAWLKKIPVIIHEQTIAAGLANKSSSPFATKIALAREESKKYYGDKKTIWVGNPINSQIINLKNPHSAKGSVGGKQILYITGGSRGSQIINQIVFDSLEELTKNYFVIHQVGELDFEKAERFTRDKYKPVAFLTPSEVAEIYSKASLVISRAGANTIAELAYLQIPTIFIPIPWTRYDEQTKNALLAEEIGFGKILHQDELNKNNLLNLISNFKIKINKLNLQKVSKDKDAAKNIVDLIKELLL